MIKCNNKKFNESKFSYNVLGADINLYIIRIKPSLYGDI